jgi:HSP20 family protein
MALIPWRNKQQNEPVRAEVSPLSNLRGEIDRLFDSFLREPWRALEWPLAGGRGWTPTVDVSESDAEFTVRAEIPGIDPKELDVHITGSQLVLSGEKKESSEKKGKDFYQAESNYGSFRREIPLPQSVDAEKVQAECAHGVLTIHLPKVQSATPKRIDIEVK